MRHNNQLYIEGENKDVIIHHNLTTVTMYIDMPSKGGGRFIPSRENSVITSRGGLLKSSSEDGRKIFKAMAKTYPLCPHRQYDKVLGLIM